MNNSVAILAGGMGTRLKSRTGVLPKVMALLMDKPVLEYQILLCKKHNLLNIILLVHYEYEVIRSYFGDGSKWGVTISYVVEEKPRGTAGALFDSLYELNDIFLVLYGDTYLDIDLTLFISFHNSKGSKASILVHPNDHPQDSDLVEINSNNEVIKIHPYPHNKDRYYGNLVNAALYIFDKRFVESFLPKDGKFDLAKDTFPLILETNNKIFAYKSQEYIKDMGTPERLDKVENDIINGLPERLSICQARSAIFIDRDGTINNEVNHLKKPEDFKLIEGVGEAIKKLNRNGYLAVCITNQPVIARGELSFEDLNNIHNKMDFELGLKGAYLDMVYTCPHHPISGFKGEVKELKVLCNCRKPKTGLVDKAVSELNIDRRTSWFIGDTTSDIKTGKSSGLSTILLRTGYAGYDLKYEIEPDFIFSDLLKAVNFILHGYSKLVNDIIPILKSISESRLILIGGPARAGKSTLAQIIKQQILLLGKRVHVISLDGWLLPVENRVEGQGVINRYNLNEIRKQFESLIESKLRHEINIPIYDRLNRTSNKSKNVSIGPNDIILLEGVIGLMDNYLCSKANHLIFIDIQDDEREDRLHKDYYWRKADLDIISKTLASRALEELQEVRNSSKNSTFKILT